MGSLWRLAMLLVVGLLAAGCSPESNLGGDRLPVQNPAESYGQVTQPLNGTLTMDSRGCWFLAVDDVSRLVIFPDGYAKGENGVTMVAPDGTSFADGAPVDADGGVVPIEDFPGVPDGYWGGYFAFCEPDSVEALVVDSMELAG